MSDQELPADQSTKPPSTDIGPEPTPQTDEKPPEGPGGVDSVPDWEDADPNPTTPDQPTSAQMDESSVPDEIKEPEEMDESKQDAPEDEDQSVKPGRDEPA